MCVRVCVLLECQPFSLIHKRSRDRETDVIGDWGEARSFIIYLSVHTSAQLIKCVCLAAAVSCLAVARPGVLVRNKVLWRVVGGGGVFFRPGRALTQLCV